MRPVATDSLIIIGRHDGNRRNTSHESGYARLQRLSTNPPESAKIRKIVLPNTIAERLLAKAKFLGRSALDPSAAH
jgi:hypothetical protein